VNDPEVVKRLNAAGTDAAPSKSAEDFAQFIQAERDYYRDIVAKAGISRN